MPKVLLHALMTLLVAGIGCRGPATDPSSAIPEAHPPQTQFKPASIVLIVVDCMRADELAADHNGIPVLPGLRQLAQRGWTFTRAYAHSTWTKPSVTSLLTPTYPEVHRVLFGLDMKPSPVTHLLEPEIDVVPPEYLTLAGVMKSAGRRTIGIQANALLGAEFGFSTGFEIYDAKYANARELTDMTLQAVAAQPSPFFTYVHYMDLHDPYDAPPAEFACPFGTPPSLADPETRRQCFGQEPPPPSAQEHASPEQYYHQLLFRAACRNAPELPPITEEGKRYLRFYYDWNAAYVDGQIRRLIESLQAQHENIYFAITADHGEEFWEHGNLGHTRTPYEETARVPLIMLGPDLVPCAVDALVEHVDVAPSLAGLAKIDPPTQWQGRNMATSDRRAFSDKKQVFSMTRSWQRSANQYIEMVLEDPYKLIRDRTKRTLELYDLLQDPGETRNLAANDPAAASRLASILERHAEEPHPYKAIPVPVLHAVSPEVAGQIEALGYGSPSR